MERVSFQREFSLQRETRVRISDREKNLPSTETTGQPCSFLFFLSFFFSMPSLFDLALHKPQLLKFYSPFNYPPLFSRSFFLLLLLAIFPSLWILYIYIHFDASANGVIFESCDSSASSSSCSIRSNIVRMKFSQTLLPAYKNTTEEKEKKREREGRMHIKSNLPDMKFVYDRRSILEYVADRRTIRFRLFFRHPSRVFTRIGPVHDSIRPRYC